LVSPRAFSFDIELFIAIAMRIIIASPKTFLLEISRFQQ